MTSKLSTSTLAPHLTVYSPPAKDYAAAFGALQSQYGFGGFPTPSVPKGTEKRKWYKWGESCSSSTASLMKRDTRADAMPSPVPSRHVTSSVGTLSESERRLGKLMAEHGFGPASQAHFYSK